MGQKLAAVPLFGGGGSAVSASSKMWPGEAYLSTKWQLDPSSHLATTDMVRKFGATPLWGGAGGSPSNTMWSGPSLILIHPSVWPQYTNVTDRQTTVR